MITDEQIDALLLRLDEYATEIKPIRYGLPILSNHRRELLRQIVRDWLHEIAGPKPEGRANDQRLLIDAIRAEKDYGAIQTRVERSLSDYISLGRKHYNSTAMSYSMERMPLAIFRKIYLAHFFRLQRGVGKRTFDLVERVVNGAQE